MGTASLIFGLILIGFGLSFGLLMFIEMIQAGNSEEKERLGFFQSKFQKS